MCLWQGTTKAVLAAQRNTSIARQKIGARLTSLSVMDASSVATRTPALPVFSDADIMLGI